MKRPMFVFSLVAALTFGCGEKAETKKDEKPRLKGEGYGDGLIATPLKAKFAAETRIKVDFVVADALRFYKAENGKAPQNQQEFEKMLKQVNATLPKPQDGFRYQWNAKEEKVDIVPVE